MNAIAAQVSAESNYLKGSLWKDSASYGWTTCETVCGQECQHKHNKIFIDEIQIKCMNLLKLSSTWYKLTCSVNDEVWRCHLVRNLSNLGCPAHCPGNKMD